MAHMVLERLRETGVRTIPPGHRIFHVATLVGNLEWREISTELAQLLPFFRLRRSTTENSDDGTASWMNRISRFRSHARSSSSQIATETSERTDAVLKTNMETQEPFDKAVRSTIGSQQLVAAHEKNEEERTQASSSSQTHDWTTVHAIFINMGGFRLIAKAQDGHMQYRTINGFQLVGLLRTGALSPIPNVSRQEILDKSKTDAFARWLAIFQCFWLLLEMIARKAESLPSSQFEVATMAFACCSVLTYFAVRDKPKDVDIAFDISSTVLVMEGIPSSSDPLFERPVSFFLEIFCYKYWQPEGYNCLIPGPGRVPTKKRRIRWGQQGAGERFTNDNYLVRNYRSHPMAGWLIIGSAVFGGIHCAAWDYYFASSLERRLWRAAALITTLAPLLLPIIDRGANSFQRIFNIDRYSTRARWFMNFWTAVLPLMVMLVYLLLRISLIVLVFSSLRAMPEGVYHTTWSRYLLSVH